MPFVTSLEVFILGIRTQETDIHTHTYIYKYINTHTNTVCSMVPLHFRFYSLLLMCVCYLYTHVLAHIHTYIRTSTVVVACTFQCHVEFCAFVALHMYLLCRILLLLLQFVSVRDVPLQLTAGRLLGWSGARSHMCLYICTFTHIKMRNFAFMSFSQFLLLFGFLVICLLFVFLFNSSF